MILGRQFIQKMYSDDYEEERLYSTGNEELDDLLEKAFCEGYEYAQKEFTSKASKKRRDEAIWKKYDFRPNRDNYYAYRTKSGSYRVDSEPITLDYITDNGYNLDDFIPVRGKERLKAVTSAIDQDKAFLKKDYREQLKKQREDPLARKIKDQHTYEIIDREKGINHQSGTLSDLSQEQVREVGKKELDRWKKAGVATEDATIETVFDRKRREKIEQLKREKATKSKSTKAEGFISKNAGRVKRLFNGTSKYGRTGQVAAIGGTALATAGTIYGAKKLYDKKKKDKDKEK